MIRRGATGGSLRGGGEVRSARRLVTRSQLHPPNSAGGFVSTAELRHASSTPARTRRDCRCRRRHGGHSRSTTARPSRCSSGPASRRRTEGPTPRLHGRATPCSSSPSPRCSWSSRRSSSSSGGCERISVRSSRRDDVGRSTMTGSSREGIAMDSTLAPVLVTGATGNVGREVVRSLVSLGVPFVAAASEPERARSVLGGATSVLIGARHAAPRRRARFGDRRPAHVKAAGSRVSRRRRRRSRPTPRARGPRRRPRP